ncbi:amino acid ABC transporter substrate-binding protein [Brucella intermedia]|uniref:amino acid ABC transporter substrate-binding protein n=1 Tax=Brucella intermedia TaxID=94625 RepID=UPI00224AE6E4|nr:amino acid ABC transporter substrate-binding protein [Brucella intermedia]
MKKILCGVVLGLSVFSGGATVASASTLEDVKARGVLQCGVNSGLAGFASPNDKGEWQGFSVDYCKAIAAAVFGDASKVKYIPLTSKDRTAALQSGEVDLISREFTWTINRDTALGFNFRPINFYDGQGFMVRKDLDAKSVRDLDGASICLQSGTTTELNVADYFRTNGMKYEPLLFDKQEELDSAYDNGRCDVYTADQSALYAVRLKLKDPDNHMVLPEIISKEPLGLAVRQGDDQWLDIVSWVHYALINAEEFGITQANVAKMKSSTNPDIQRFLGVESGSKIGVDLGLTNEWAENIIKAVGNYGEIFERTVGKESPLKIDRGLNQLWNKGGIQYAPPVR